MKREIDKFTTTATSAATPAPVSSTPPPADCPTWLVVVLYLSSFGLVFYVLYQIEASLGQL